MANITANVVDGVLDYSYTDKKAEKKQASGSNMDYDQFLQLLVAEMQYQDPLEPTTNTEYVAQLATFSQLEATMAMQNTMTNDMASSLVGKQVIITETSDSTGKTNTVTGNVDYVVYQEGEAYLSVNGNLYSIEDLDTVVDDAYYEAAEMVKTFQSMLAQLPNVNDIKSIYEGAVNDIREFYDGMTSYQQKFVDKSDLADLESYEMRIRELKNAEGGDGVAENFSKTIAALPEVEELTAGDQTAVRAARLVYEDMTEAQKEQVKEEDLTKLTALEERMAELTASV